MSTIAFIGHGIMDSPMAVHLQNAGHTVLGHNRSPERAAPLVEAGDAGVSSVAAADVVPVMVPDAPGVVAPVGSLVAQLMAAARATGDGTLDHSGLFQTIARLSGRN